jgi:DNA-directed RNA polymerase specialized sigma24 family protein
MSNPTSEGLREQVRGLAANRHSPEAKALFMRLAEFIERRSGHLIHHRYSDLLSPAEHEELVGEVLLELMAGALATFRGDSEGELYAFVRSIADRCVWRRAQRRLRERRAVESEETASLVAAWNSTMAAPERAAEPGGPDCPFTERDAAWLRELLTAGSRAELARRHGVSRAAVTQRVQRIRARIEQMAPRDQARAESWLQQAAREAEASRPD